jgi:transcriptional regulatory protein LevR
MTNALTVKQVIDFLSEEYKDDLNEPLFIQWLGRNHVNTKVSKNKFIKIVNNVDIDALTDEFHSAFDNATEI